jgi:hypothetical protein
LKSGVARTAAALADLAVFAGPAEEAEASAGMANSSADAIETTNLRMSPPRAKAMSISTLPP